MQKIIFSEVIETLGGDKGYVDVIVLRLAGNWIPLPDLKKITYLFFPQQKYLEISQEFGLAYLFKAAIYYKLY